MRPTLLKRFFSVTTCLLLTVICFSANAQQTTYRLHYDIALFDLPGGVVENPSDNIVFAGTNLSFLPIYGTVTEVDPIGNVQWSKGYTASIATQINDIKNIPSGGYIVTGTASSGAMLMNLSSTGTVNWAYEYNVTGADDEYGSHVLPTSDGGFVVAGYVYGADPDGAGPLAAQDSANLFCFKVNSSGVLQWSDVFFVSTSYINDHAFSDVAEVSDGYIFVGYSSQSGSSENTDAIVLKTNTSGVRQWSYRFSSANEASAIKALSGTQVLITGDKDGTGLGTTVVPYYIKLSSAGAVQTGNQYNFGLFSVDVALGTDIFTTNDGNYAMAGFYTEFNVPPVISSFLVKVNASNGNIMFQKYYSPTTSSLIGVSLFPEGLQASDSAYVLVSTAFGTSGGGYDYELVRADENGQLNNTGCPEANMSLTRSGFTPSLSSFTPSVTTSASRSTVTMVSINLNPDTSLVCRTIVCNPPPKPSSVTSSNNNFCPGGSTTIDASGSGSNVTYYVYNTSTGGTALGSTPLSVSPTTTTTYYVEASDNNNPLCVSSREAITVTVKPGTPATPGTISGPNPACPGSRTYSISSVAGATNYNWSLSGGGTISGTGLSASVNWTTPGTYTISVTAENSCGTSSARTLSVTVDPGPPSQPGAITGNINPCPGAESYSIGSVANATTYTWSVSSGGSITGGQGTTNATITWSSTGGPYTISVTAGNSCGTSAARTLAVNVQNGPPSSIGSITGNTNVCVGSQPYSVPGVTGATTYTWSVSGGGSVTGGQGTANATVNWTAAGTYTVSVTASNPCGNVSATPISVTVAGAPPATPGPITGADTTCGGNQTYTISAVAGADSYSWSVSGGGTTVSGANSTSYTVNWTTAGTYTVSVTASNACGSSSAATYQVTVSSGVPATPGPITGSTSVCAGSESYSISAVSGATGYTWAVSGGGTITSGQNSTGITVNWTTSGGPYTVSVTPYNVCGNGTAATLNVTVLPANPPEPDSVSGNTPVCFGTETYTAASVTGASGYTWSVSGGGSISNGQGTASADINWTTAGTWTISVTADNQCGSSSATTTTVEVLPASPATPGNITGPTAVCPDTASYSIPAVPGASGYTWSLSGGGTIIAGQGTNSIDIDWASVSGTYTVSVTADNQCGSSTASTTSVLITPGPPTGTPVIAGDVAPCPGTQTYTVSGVNGAGTYTWTLSSGGSIISGQGTSSLTVDWTTTGGPYTLAVTPSNTCGDGTPDSVSVTVDGPPDIGLTTVSGDTNPCPGTESYSIPAVVNSTGYTWSVSGGGSITGGQGTTTVSIDWTTSGGPYTVSVTADNACGSSSSVTTSVTVEPGPPATPGAITGPTSVCEGTSGSSYSINSVTDATNYTWSVSSGGSITGGQGTTSATIDWTGAPGNYTVSVTAENACGTSTAATLTVTITPGPPNTPLAINGPVSVCPGIENYSVASVANATGYTWSLSGGGTISNGQGSSNITVNWTTSGGPYTVSVTASNNCGTSTAQTASVTVLASPTAPTITSGNDTICEGESATITATGSTGGNITYNIYDSQSGGTQLGVSPLTVNPTTTTTYYVEVVNDLGCTYAGGRVPATVFVNPAPAAPTITGDGTTVCYGESTTLTATISGGGSVTWWNAATGGTLLSSGTTLNTGTLTSTTTFYAEVTSSNGCGSLTGRVGATVEVAPLPVVILSSDATDNTIFINQALTAIADPDGYDQYEFFLNGVQIQIDSINTWASSVLEDGDVISVIPTEGGCIGEEVEITVHVSDYPNVFTPNGDGRNDIFLAGFDLVIINRWGQELYHGEDGWDGTYNGEKVSPGTYFYIVRVKDITDKENIVKGSVLVHF